MRGLRIGRNLRADNLQGNAATLKQVIFCFVDLTHAASRDKPNDGKASGDNIARLESGACNCRNSAADSGSGDVGPLLACPHLRLLTTLDLADNDIGDAGAEALATSSHLARLTDLDLRYNDIGDAGAEALRKRFGECVSF